MYASIFAARFASASATAAANSASTSTAQANRAEAEANRAANIDAYTKDVSDTRYSNALTGTASGAMAHMTDVGIGSLRRLAVQGETIETGTGDKGPDNPYALAGVMPTKATVCGKNILKSQAQSGSANGITWTVDVDGAIHPTGTATAQVVINILPNATTPYFWLDHPVYSSSNSALRVSVKVVYENGTIDYKSINAGDPFPLQLPCGVLGAYFQYASGNTASGTLYPYLGLEANHPYEPYTGTTVTLPTLEPLCGDGTINDEYDAATGIETRRWKRVELDGTESGWRTSTAADNVKLRYVLPVTNVLNPPTTYDTSDITCTHYLSNSPYNNWNGIQSVCASGGNLVFFDSAYGSQDLAAWKSYLAAQKTAGTPVTVVYRLATPEVTQHDPERIVPPAPVCNAYADQGDVDVTYNRDINMAWVGVATKEYVDQQLGVIENGSY